MDLRSIINNDSGAAGSAQQEVKRSPELQRNSAAPIVHPASYGAHGPPPAHQQAQAPRPTPPAYYQPPTPLESRSAPQPYPQSARTTPLRTPQHTPGGSQYPFPPQYVQSPSQAHPAAPGYFPQRGETYPVVTPGPRPSPYQPQHGHGSPSGFAPPPLPLGHSHSPTPSSARNVTPHSVRESPASVQSHGQPAYQQPLQHHSQPSTPVGGPPLQYTGSSSQMRAEMASPYAVHQRNISGASYGGMQNMPSPAQHNSAVGHLLESPASFNRPPPSPYQKRPSGDYAQMDRERSLSVSPKTMVPPRHLSASSRQSSQDHWSQRGSVTSEAQNARRMPSGSDMSTPLPPPQSQQSQQSQPRYTSQTPHLSNLLTGDTVVNHQTQPQPATPQTYSRQPSYPPSHPTPQPPSSERNLSSNLHTPAMPPGKESLLQQPINATPLKAEPDVVFKAEHTPTDAPKPLPQAMVQKRPAESEPEVSAPPKKVKHRYDEPPIWARRMPGNPLFDGKNGPLRDGQKPQPRMNPQTHRPSPRPAPQAVPQPPPQSAPQSNGHPVPNGNVPLGAPLDHIKAQASALLGQWELSITDTEPADQFLHSVCAFLYRELSARPDLGAGDARNGQLEIEAKIGTLVDRDSGQRIRFPVQNAVVLDPGWSPRQLKFESFMTEQQHAQLNQYLNKCTELSLMPPKTPNTPKRVPMKYLHRYERDSFVSLTPAGYNALPPIAKQYADPRKSLRLRTTVDTKNPAHPVIARIVKIRLADLDIYSPNTEYDCRISINIEVDFHTRTDIDASLLAAAAEKPGPGKEKPQDRNKNRVSYSHLLYQVDLTQVTESDGRKIHELEVEIDGARLKEQILLLEQKRPNAFETVVKGLMDNVALLMKARGPEDAVKG